MWTNIVKRDINLENWKKFLGKKDSKIYNATWFGQMIDKYYILSEKQNKELVLKNVY